MKNDTEIIGGYLDEVQKTLATGEAHEHAYRPAFQRLIEELTEGITVINEPAYKGANAPDFLFKKDDVPIAYAECKDLDVAMDDKAFRKQAERYVGAFGKILRTNYTEFEIIEEGRDEMVAFAIAKIVDGKIVPLSENFDHAANLIRDYISVSHRSITSAKKLAQIMAHKAQILRDNALASLSENPNADIAAQYKTFKEVLIRDLSEEDFSDMYAQTLVYGLFVARYHDPTLKTFSRHEAQDLLPSTNPLLKKFFGHVAGTDYDQKIAWLVDSLIEAFLAADVYGIMHKEFKKKQKDPVLHFYETFLTEYDQKLRKSRGVYYTPEPVVSFIVRSVDQILKQKFDLPKGLSDTSKIETKEKVQGADGRTKDGAKSIKKEIHKVQILDPAVGTGTFLNEVIHEIHKGFEGQEGLWNPYVKENLLPRLHGFELMMASYTMAHLKLGVTLDELGYKGDERLSVWLTNSLEEGVHEVPNLFMSQWLTEESNQASRIKSDTPVMVVIGNPPYSGVSSNNSKSAIAYADKYKIEPGGTEKLQERKHWLNDDYVKFISFAEDQIEKTGEGVFGYINPHGFIDNPTFRGMRWHLLKTFDEIYILDLHGNSKKKEMAPDGSKDENVFDIQQGVSIVLGVKFKEGKNKLATVYHADIFGKRNEKYKVLNELDFEKTDWQKVEYKEPYYFFVQKDYESETKYQKNFSINELFVVNSVGFVTANDKLNVSFTKKEHVQKIEDLLSLEELEWRVKYGRSKDSRDWKYLFAKKDAEENQTLDKIKVNYRPFDHRYTLYAGNSRGLYASPQPKVMKHFLAGKNVGLNLCRQFKSGDTYQHVLATNSISESSYISNKTSEIGYSFPLYLYHDDGTKAPNLDQEIWDKIDEVVGKTEPEDILDYIYAALHSPSYREKYKEFLKIDFPRVPYPKDKKTFERLVALGRELREIHLLESSKVEEYITTFSESGNNVIEKGYPKYKGGNVYINETQYFGDVPEVAWNFYIGGYHPAQKWLKDRKERELSTEDIMHYQKIIIALSETDRIMGEVDELKIV